MPRSPLEQARSLSLHSRIFLTTSIVAGVAVLVLMLSPVTVSSPPRLREIVVLVGGFAVLLVVNLHLLRRAFAPLRRLTALMRQVQPLEPGRRIPVEEPDDEIRELGKAFNEMLDRLEAERRASVERSLAAQESERRRIARELHDEVGQTLTAIVLQLERVSRTVSEDVRPAIIETRETARESLEDVRQIAQRLRPETLDDLGLRSSLTALAHRVGEQAGVRVACDLDETLPQLTAPGELVVYRVAQEGLTNAVRHADPKTVTLALKATGDRVRLSVRDDGHGLDGAEAGAGIQGMRERALLLGAEVTLAERPEGGTELSLVVDGEEPA